MFKKVIVSVLALALLSSASTFATCECMPEWWPSWAAYTPTPLPSENTSTAGWTGTQATTVQRVRGRMIGNGTFWFNPPIGFTTNTWKTVKYAVQCNCYT